MKRGFTLIEMLVVIGIIAVLAGAGLAGYNGAIKRAQRARGEELVHDLHVALTLALQNESAWPPPILKEGRGGDGRATVEVGAWLGKHGLFSFGTVLNPGEKDIAKRKLQVNKAEELGILTPWAEAVAKKRLKSGSFGEGTKVPSGGTIDDHRLRIAIDHDYDGFTEVKPKGVKVRASACVWCCGYDGKFNTKDDIRSWTPAQEVK